jgi:hypothetical protein
MPFLSAMMRVLLILILVLNGVGSAYASIRMGEGMGRSHSSDVSAKPEQPPEPPSSCPDHHDGMAMKPAAAEKQPASPASPDDSHGSSDCCDASHCTCPCMHACAALPLLATRTPASVGRDLGVRPLSLGHPSPALPHLIRPPIG